MKTDQTTTIYFPSAWQSDEASAWLFKHPKYQVRWHQWSVWLSGKAVGWCVILTWNN